MPDNRIVMYGTTWCPDCARAKQVLNRYKATFEQVDIEKDEKARDYIVKVNKGFQSVPTIVFPDGSILVEPSNAELEKKLGFAKSVQSSQYFSVKEV